MQKNIIQLKTSRKLFYSREGLKMKRSNTLLCTGRKIIGFLLSTLITITIITTPILAENFEIGDINRDKEINSIDLASLRGYLLGLEDFSWINERTYEADVDGDKLINSIDLAFVRQFILGKINKFPKLNLVPDNTSTPVIPQADTTPTPVMPQATRTAKPTGTTPEIPPLPVETPSPNYILQVPTQYPDKLNTIISSDANIIIPNYLDKSVSFRVFLFDNSNKPLAGKTVSWNWDPNLGEKPGEKICAVTDSNGAAVFTITSNFDDTITYEVRNRFMNFYFDGDEEYNAIVCQKMVLAANNGEPTGIPKPLPSPILDPDKVNTNIKIHQDIQSTSGWFSLTSTFSVKLVNDKGEPLEGKKVKWVDGAGYVYDYDVQTSVITDSNGVAVFSFTQSYPEDCPFNSKKDVFINISFEGDDTNNPSVYYTKISIPYIDFSEYN